MPCRGETIVRKIHRNLDSADGDGGRDLLLRQCAGALAAIHRADPDNIGFDRKRTADRTAHPARRDARHHRDIRVGVSLAGRASAAADTAAAGTGDFRMGNLIVDESGLAAVLDWELVHIGEVYEDLAWFCNRAWRFGAPEALGAGGLGSIQSFLSAYEKAAGIDLDRDAFRWWLIVATLRWGVICRVQPSATCRGRLGRSSWPRSAAASAKPNETYWIFCRGAVRGELAVRAADSRRTRRGRRRLPGLRRARRAPV